MRDTKWINYQKSSSVTVRYLLRQKVKQEVPGALSFLDTTHDNFNFKVDFNSIAHKEINQKVEEIKEVFLNNISLVQRDTNPWLVGSIMAKEGNLSKFNYALHKEGYSELNKFEEQFARKVDELELDWCRNPISAGYSIPLVKIGNTSKFYPDFLIWSKDKKVIFAVDTKGEHLIKEAVGKKLLNLKPSSKNKTNLVVYFVSKGKWDKSINLQSKNGYTLWGIRKEDNEILSIYHEELSEVLNLMISHEVE